MNFRRSHNKRMYKNNDTAKYEMVIYDTPKYETAIYDTAINETAID